MQSRLCMFFLMFLQFFTILYPRFRFTESKNLKKLFVHLDVRFHFLQTEHQTRPGTHTHKHTHFILVQTGRNMCHRNLTQKLNQTKPQKTTVCQPDVQLTKQWASARFKTSRSLTSANVSTTTATIRFNTLANHRVKQVNTANIFSVQNHIHAAQKKLLGNKQSIMINLPATKGGGAMPAIVAMITLSSSSSSSSASPKQPCNVCNGICRCNWNNCCCWWWWWWWRWWWWWWWWWCWCCSIMFYVVLYCSMLLFYVGLCLLCRSMSFYIYCSTLLYYVVLCCSMFLLLLSSWLSWLLLRRLLLPDNFYFCYDNGDDDVGGDCSSSYCSSDANTLTPTTTTTATTRTSLATSTTLSLFESHEKRLHRPLP